MRISKLFVVCLLRVFRAWLNCNVRVSTEMAFWQCEHSCPILSTHTSRKTRFTTRTSGQVVLTRQTELSSGKCILLVHSRGCSEKLWSRTSHTNGQHYCQNNLSTRKMHLISQDRAEIRAVSMNIPHSLIHEPN